MNTSGKIWKSIPNYPNYLISECGEIMSVVKKKCTYPGKILKQYTHKEDRFCIRLYNNSGNKGKEFQVHRLVALAFIGPCPEGKQINHKDGNHRNNHFSNLEYVTCRENTIHAFNLGLRRAKKGIDNHFSKLTEQDVIRIRQLLASGMSTRQVSRMYGLSHSTAWDINRKTWRHIPSQT